MEVEKETNSVLVWGAIGVVSLIVLTIFFAQQFTYWAMAIVLVCSIVALIAELISEQPTKLTIVCHFTNAALAVYVIATAQSPGIVLILTGVVLGSTVVGLIAEMIEDSSTTFSVIAQAVTFALAALIAIGVSFNIQ